MGVLSIFLLIISNIFMTLAWYGHLKFEEWGWIHKTSLISVIFISWGIALLEYCFQVPANKIGYVENGGPFSLIQLKVIQEVITLFVFVIFSTLFFKTESFNLNHFIAFILIIIAVYLVFKK